MNTNGETDVEIGHFYLDLGLGHMAYCCVALIDLYLHTEFR